MPMGTPRCFEIMEWLWQPFGEDRLIYGSNWPACTHFASYATVQQIVEAFFVRKGPRAAAKYFRGNAAKVYKFTRR